MHFGVRVFGTYRAHFCSVAWVVYIWHTAELCIELPEQTDACTHAHTWNCLTLKCTRGSQSSPHTAVLSHYSYMVLTQRPTVYTALTANTEPITCTTCTAEY